MAAPPRTTSAIAVLTGNFMRLHSSRRTVARGEHGHNTLFVGERFQFVMRYRAYLHRLGGAGPVSVADPAASEVVDASPFARYENRAEMRIASHLAWHRVLHTGRFPGSARFS